MVDIKIEINYFSIALLLTKNWRYIQTPDQFV